MSRLQMLFLAVLGAAALSLAACGDTAEKNDYVDQVNEVQTTLEAEIGKLGQDVTSPEQLTTFYDDAATQLGAAAADLEGISPPDDVADLHDKLIADVQELADLIKGAGDDIKAGGAPAVPGAVAQLSTEGSRIEADFSATIDEINSTLQG